MDLSNTIQRAPARLNTAAATGSSQSSLMTTSLPKALELRGPGLCKSGVCALALDRPINIFGTLCEFVVVGRREPISPLLYLGLTSLSFFFRSLFKNKEFVLIPFETLTMVSFLFFFLLVTGLFFVIFCLGDATSFSNFFDRAVFITEVSKTSTITLLPDAKC